MHYWSSFTLEPRMLYATTKRVPGKEGRDESISNRAAAAALGIEPVQLRIWKRTIDQIRDQPKGSWRNKQSHPCAFPEMERQVTRLFGEKMALGRRREVATARKSAFIHYTYIN
jgi:hypothetical protein